MSIKSFFTRPGSKCEIREAILNDIASANQRIYLAMAYIDDAGFISSIIQSKASDKRVILNLRDVKANTANYQSIFQGFFQKITKVLGSDNGYYSTMHHKFLIIDDIVWIGSYNFTKSARDRNWENMIRIDCGDETVKSYEEEFNQMWNTGHYLSSELNGKIQYNNGKLFCKDCHEEIIDVVKHFLVEFNAFDYTILGLEQYFFICGRDHLDPEIDCCNCNNTIEREKVYSVGFADAFGDGEEKYYCPGCFTKLKEEKRLTDFPTFPMMEDIMRKELNESYDIIYKRILVDDGRNQEIFSGNDIDLAHLLGKYPGELSIGVKLEIEMSELRITEIKNDYSEPNVKNILVFLEAI